MWWSGALDLKHADRGWVKILADQRPCRVSATAVSMHGGQSLLVLGGHDKSRTNQFGDATPGWEGEPGQGSLAIEHSWACRLDWSRPNPGEADGGDGDETREEGGLGLRASAVRALDEHGWCYDRSDRGQMETLAGSHESRGMPLGESGLDSDPSHAVPGLHCPSAICTWAAGEGEPASVVVAVGASAWGHQEVQGLCALVLDITGEEQHYRLPSAARMAELREQGRALAKSFGIPLGGLEPDGDQEPEPEPEPQSQPEIEPETGDWLQELLEPPDLRPGQANDSDEIIPGLFLGSSTAARAAADPSGGSGVGGVVNCAVVEGLPGSIDGTPCYDAGARERLGYVELPMTDGSTGVAEPWLDPGADAVHALFVAGRVPVLVHCAAGKSRSATVVIAYLVKHKGMSLRQAATLARSKRSRAYPRSQFWEALMRWEPTVRPGQGCSLPPHTLTLHAENRADGGSDTAKVSQLSEMLAVGEAEALAALEACGFDPEQAAARLMAQMSLG